jgi:copper chaperone CopZ
MKEYSLKLSGMSCGSCEKIIEKVILKNSGNVKKIDANNGLISFEASEELLPKIKSELEERGFAESQPERGHFGNAIKYVKSVVAGRTGFEVENTLLNYSIFSSITIVAISFLIYYFILRNLDNSLGYLHVLAYALLISVPITFSFFHLKCYRNKMTCQNGMMVGMITGMVSGFLIGALIGAANGMFMGSLLGMVFGIGIGLELGRCCGIMGALEGIMAGIMSGIMGAMTSVMLYNDNLLVLLYVLFGFCILVLGGASYMMHREAGKIQLSELNIDMVSFVLYATLFFMFLVMFAIYGPKSTITFRW